MPNLRVLIMATIVTVFTAHGSFCADRLFLKSGGQINGDLLNPSETPRQRFIVKTLGGKITLSADQVKRFTRQSDQQRNYEKHATSMSDSIEDHWELSQWCLNNQLAAERKTHLERVIELDPDHDAARRALGYQFIDGRWLTSKELMKQRGFIHYQGVWRTQQDVALLQEQQRIELVKKEYIRKIKVWSRWLRGPRREQAMEKLSGINDPLAAPALIGMLRVAADPSTKELTIDLLGRLGGEVAVSALIQSALEDPSEAIRDRCLEQLGHIGTHVAAVTFIKTLQHKNNLAVNRAAVGLERLEDESAILPLIRTLRTEHKFIIRQPGGGINPVFGSGGNGGLSAGESRPKIIKKTYENESVLRALVSITGENFRFDVQRWMDWYSFKETPNRVTLRRDP